MAMLTKPRLLGIDVSKDWLDIFDGHELAHIENKPKAILGFLHSLEKSTSISIESTNRYHELFVQQALALGHTIYLVDGFRLSRYRDAIGVRIKNDISDAKVLHRYLSSELPQLKPYQLPNKVVKRLTNLLQARAKLIQSKCRIQQSLGNIKELTQTCHALSSRIEHAIELIDKRLQKCVRGSEYDEDYRRCLGIPGVGPTNATALVAYYHRGVFSKADTFIAFIGLDIRVRESGRFKGKRKVTKQGNPEIRRLLFNAARAGGKTKAWNSYYLSLRERGLSTTAATVAISRKIAKLAFALMRDQTEYQPQLS